MTTTSSDQITTIEPSAPCPHWCTRVTTDPSHRWERNLDGTISRIHGHKFDGFSVTVLETRAPDGTSTFTELECCADFDSFDSSVDARELAATLAEVTVVMSAAESLL